MKLNWKCKDLRIPLEIRLERPEAAQSPSFAVRPLWHRQTGEARLRLRHEQH
jgi:hypothetical protein